MPRYLFQYTDGRFTHGAVSQEFDNVEDARLEAVVYAARTLAKRPEIVWTGRELEVQVAHEGGEVIFTVKIAGHTALPSDSMPAGIG